MYIKTKSQHTKCKNKINYINTKEYYTKNVYKKQKHNTKKQKTNFINTKRITQNIKIHVYNKQQHNTK